jgi:hypothetical protein
MLTHELNNFTMSEAMKFYTQLKAAFKHLVPMGVATNQTQPYVETNYSLPSFDQCTINAIFITSILTLVQTSAARQQSPVVSQLPRRGLPVQQGSDHLLGKPIPLVLRAEPYMTVLEYLPQVQHSLASQGNSWRRILVPFLFSLVFGCACGMLDVLIPCRTWAISIGAHCRMWRTQRQPR